MENSFYITSQDTPHGKWYNLRVYPTHFCISAGYDLEVIKKVIKRYVNDYREPEEMLNALKTLSSGGKVSRAAFEQYEEYYKKHGNDYRDFIKEAVRSVSREKKEELGKRLKSGKKIVRSLRSGEVYKEQGGKKRINLRLKRV